MSEENEMKNDDLEEALLTTAEDQEDQELEKRPHLDRFFSAPVGSLLHLSKGSSMRGTVLNLINTVTGAGILALPLAIRDTGLVLGLVLLWLVNFATDRTVQLLLYSIDANGTKSFAALSSKLYGHTFKIIVDLNTFLLNFGICTSYVVIIGTLLSDFAKHEYGGKYFTNRAQILLTIAPLVFLPLSCLKRLDALRHVSFVALTFLFSFVVITVMIAFGVGNTHVPHDEDENVKLIGDKVLKFFESVRGVFVSLPLFFFSLSLEKIHRYP